MTLCALFPLSLSLSALGVFGLPFKAQSFPSWRALAPQPQSAELVQQCSATPAASGCHRPMGTARRQGPPVIMNEMIKKTHPDYSPI